MIERKTIGGQVFDYLLEQISSGKLQPGERLQDERSLASDLGVSRVPLREAISSLCQIGILSSRQGEGTFVSTDYTVILKKALGIYVQLEDQVVSEVIELRKIMEVEAARLATINATDEEIEEIKSISKKRHELVNQNLAEEQLHILLDDYDKQFHQAIAKATHNSVFLNFINTIRNSLSIHQKKASEAPGMMHKVYAQHKNICDALSQRDSEKAATVMKEHLEAVESVINKNLEE